MKTRIYVEPEYEGILQGVLPLHDHDGMMAFSGGEVVGKGPQKAVRRIRCAKGGFGAVFYLKQVFQHSPLALIKAAMKTGDERILTDREVRLLELHREVGVPVMRMSAWGRKDVFGVPVSGFLLVEGVEGEDFGTVYHRMNFNDRRGLMAAYGALVGYMHLKGLDSLVRTTDIICVSDRFEDYKESFVLIDREWGGLRLAPMSLEVRLKRLAIMFIKIDRWLGIPSKREMLAFLDAYLKETSGLPLTADYVYRKVAGKLAETLDYDPCVSAAEDRPWKNQGPAGPGRHLN